MPKSNKDRDNNKEELALYYAGEGALSETLEEEKNGVDRDIMPKIGSFTEKEASKKWIASDVTIKARDEALKIFEDFIVKIDTFLLGIQDGKFNKDSKDKVGTRAIDRVTQTYIKLTLNLETADYLATHSMRDIEDYSKTKPGQKLIELYENGADIFYKEDNEKEAKEGSIEGVIWGKDVRSLQKAMRHCRHNHAMKEIVAKNMRDGVGGKIEFRNGTGDFDKDLDTDLLQADNPPSTKNITSTQTVTPITTKSTPKSRN